MFARGRIRLTALFLGAILMGAGAATRAAGPVTPDKVAVIDGHVVHDAGDLLSHQSNWGLIGSMPGTSMTFSDSPSAMWPKWSGNEYLWAAGIWVGARDAQGVPHVTTAGYPAEFLPTEAPADTIYQTAQGAPGGVRYPYGNPDDDGDGREDEDPLNGLDDDGDGLVDEDFAAIGDQHFLSRYNDTEAALAPLLDHVPLGLNVQQQSFQWSAEGYGRVIGYDFTITNTGPDALQDVFVGMFSDADIGPRGTPGVADDDLAGYEATTVVQPDGTYVPVYVAWIRDAAATNPLPGYSGWVLCGFAVDDGPMQLPAPRSFQAFEGNAAFDNGGDPTNDHERYELLSRDEIDPNPLPARTGDYRTLLSAEPGVDLASGSSLRFLTAFVIGDGLDDLVQLSANAVQTAWGRFYDRDGDPANGAEFHVPWIRPEEEILPPPTGSLSAQASGRGADLTAIVPEAWAGMIELRREALHHLDVRTWSADAFDLVGPAGGGVKLVLRDDEPGPWPRRYELAALVGGDRVVLDTAVALRSARSRARVSAGPNPFNPRVVVKLAVPQAGRAVLQAYDVRGHRVATILDTHLEAGERAVTWEGRDDAGRSLPSGAYYLRLESGGELVETRVTLLR